MRIRPHRTSPATPKMDFAHGTDKSHAKRQFCEESQSSRPDVAEQVKTGYISLHDEPTNITYLKPDFLDPLINTKVDSVCPSPLAMLARTCQNIGQMYQQPKSNPGATGNSNNNSCDQNLPANTTRHRGSNSSGNPGITSMHFAPESNGTCSTGTIANTGSLDYNSSSVLARCTRMTTTNRPVESKSQDDHDGAELIALYGRRNVPAKAKRLRTEQMRHSATQRSSPSPTSTAGSTVQSHNMAHDKHSTAIRLASSTNGQKFSKFTSPAANSPGSLGAYAYSSADGGTPRNRPDSLSPSNEYLSDCGSGTGNSSNALAQLARLSSSLPLPDPPRLSTNQHNGFHSQSDAQVKPAGQNWFDPLRVQTGGKRARPGGSHRQSTVPPYSHTTIGHSSGAVKPSPTSIASLSSPSVSCGIPLFFSGCSTSPTGHSSTSANAYPFHHQVNKTSNSSTASSSSLSPPVSTVHSQWLSLINSLQHMASAQHQKDDQSRPPTGHQTDVLSYQLAHNFLDYFYGKMKNGSGDFHSLMANQMPGSAGPLPMAMELATAAVAAAATAAANRPDKEHRGNSVGDEKTSPSQHRSSSSSSSPTSFGHNPLANALSTHAQSYDLFCQGKPQTAMADGYKCSVCGHVCCDLQEFYSHFYVHLMANSHASQQSGKLNSPSCSVHQDAIHSSSSEYNLPSSVGGSRDLPASSIDQMNCQLPGRDQFTKTLFSDFPSAMTVGSMWSRDNMMRWLSNYRNFVNTPTESKVFGGQSHGTKFTTPSTSMPAPERDSFARTENDGFNFLQAFESNDPRFMWMRLLAEHAMPSLFSASANNGTAPTNAPLPVSNPMLSPLNMANAYLTLFPQV